MNREELIFAATGWVERAKSDVREKMLSYMEKTGMNAEELAYELGVAEDAIVRITKGDGEFTLDTLAKMLIACGLVLEVKPVGISPIAEQFDIPMDDMVFDPGLFLMPHEIEDDDSEVDDLLFSDELDEYDDDAECIKNEEHKACTKEEKTKCDEECSKPKKHKVITFSSSDEDDDFPVDDKVLELKEKIRSTIKKNGNLSKFFESIFE